MGRKAKYTPDEKIWAVKEYLDGRMSAENIARALEMGKSGGCMVRRWARQYQLNGEAIFLSSEHNSSYSVQFKEEVCQAYLAGKGSYEDIAAQYGISSHSVVRRWVSKYTGSRNELKAYKPQPEVYMADRKKTTQEERVQIVQWYFEHGCSYKNTAAEFGCSYSQVRDWVIKFKDKGEDGLLDRRGKRKADDELSSEEKKDREIARLKAVNLHLQMENELLKKAEEAERRWLRDTAGSDRTR